MHDEERSGRPSLFTDELLRAGEEKIKENRKFTISALSMEFPQISRSLTHEFTTQVVTCCKEGIQKLVPRYDKCLQNGGKYVEK